MSIKTCAVLLAATLSAGLCAAQPSTPVGTSDRERVDLLIKQNLLLTEENAKLRQSANQTKSKEEVFAMCMQATHGQGAMAANSIGGHCSQILK